MQMLLFIPKAMWWLTLVLNLIDLRPIRDTPLGSVRAYFLEVLPEQGSTPLLPRSGRTFHGQSRQKEVWGKSRTVLHLALPCIVLLVTYHITAMTAVFLR